MRNRSTLGVISFALSLCALADPQYYSISGPGLNGYTYGYPSSAGDVIGALLPYVDPDFTWPSEEYPGGMGFYDPVNDGMGDVFPVDDPFGPAYGYIPDYYIPLDPAYTDPVAPSDDPLSAPSSAGGGGEGGDADPSDWLSAMLSLVRGVAVAVASLLTAAALFYIIFLWWRSFRRSMRSAER